MIKMVVCRRQLVRAAMAWRAGWRPDTPFTSKPLLTSLRAPYVAALRASRVWRVGWR